MRLLTEIIAIYVTYVFGTSLLVWRFASKDKGPAIVVAAVIPFLFFVSFFETIGSAMLGKSPSIGPCPVGLSDAELLVEEHRLKMFGGAKLVPHFASDWSRLYAKTVELEAERVQTFARKMLTVS